MRLGIYPLAMLVLNSCTSIANPVVLPPTHDNNDYAVIEQRQTMIPNQQERYDRMVQLGRDIANLDASITSIWQGIQNKGDYYMSVLNEIARLNNYTNAEAMAREAESYLAPGEVQAILGPLADSKAKMELNLDAMRYTSAAMTVFGTTGIAATSRRLKWIGYGQEEAYSGVWRTIIKWKYQTHSRAKVRFWRATGKMTTVEAENYLNKVIPKEVRKISNGAKGLAKARVFRAASKALVAADVVLAIGSIIYDIVEGLKQRDEIRKAIDELATARLSNYLEYKQMQLFVDLDNRILAALDIRVTQQTQINKGQLCYSAADQPVAQKLVDALDAYLKAADALTEQSAYDGVTQLYDSNPSSPSWRDEDPTLDEMMQMMQQRENEAGDTETPVASPAEYHVQGNAVTTATCNYVELQSSKGVLWKLRGPFWTLQATYKKGDNTLNLWNTGVLPKGNATDFRIRLSELKRDAAEKGNVYLRPTKADGTGEEGPVIIVNLASGKIQRILSPSITGGGSTPIQISGAATDWAGYDIQTDKLSNLVSGNAWTAWAFGLGNNSQSWLQECSLASGWDFGDRSGRVIKNNAFESVRNSTHVRTSGNLLIAADLANKKISTSYRSFDDEGEMVTENDVFDMTYTEPRVRWT